MLLNNRIVFSDNGTLSDLSSNLSNIHALTSTIAIVAAEDALYIGSDLPFNHRYFEVSSANAAASSVSVSLWNGSAWIAAVDVIDQTKSGTATLAASGIIAWTPNIDENWDREEESEDVTGLTGTKIYNCYWAKMTFSGNLTGTTALKYMGHKFATDSDLGGYYPDLNTSAAKTAFESGKTDWNVQHVLAAEEIIRDLRYKGLVWSENQILDWQQFYDASTHKVAEIIFTAFGSDTEEKRKAARAKYEEAMKKLNFNLDQNDNGRLEKIEKAPQYGHVIRR